MGKPIVYHTAHDRVVTARGKASEYPCVEGCGRQAYEWTYVGGDPKEIVDSKGRRYSLNVNFYAPRCRPCHRLFDSPKKVKS